METFPWFKLTFTTSSLSLFPLMFNSLEHEHILHQLQDHEDDPIEHVKLLCIL
jgi:hypothetical protein